MTVILKNWEIPSLKEKQKVFEDPWICISLLNWEIQLIYQFKWLKIGAKVQHLAKVKLKAKKENLQSQTTGRGGESEEAPIIQLNLEKSEIFWNKWLCLVLWLRINLIRMNCKRGVRVQFRDCLEFEAFSQDSGSRLASSWTWMSIESFKLKIIP